MPIPFVRLVMAPSKWHLMQRSRQQHTNGELALGTLSHARTSGNITTSGCAGRSGVSAGFELFIELKSLLEHFCERVLTDRRNR
ncbi:MAG: hypothetical protein ACI93T_004081 [Porticoccaceae bacterium]